MPASQVRHAMAAVVAAIGAATIEPIRTCSLRALYAIALAATAIGLALPSGAAWSFGAGVASNNCANCHTGTPNTPLSISVDQTLSAPDKSPS